MDQSFVAGFAAGAGVVNVIFLILLQIAKRLGIIAALRSKRTNGA